MHCGPWTNSRFNRSAPSATDGAHKIIAVATRYERTREEASVAEVVGYSPPAQTLGVLYNAIFLDLIDQESSGWHG
jgi:hypothetical protein